MHAFPFSLMYLLFSTDFYIFRNFLFFVFLVVQYLRSVIYKIKRLDTNTRDFGYIVLNDRLWQKLAALVGDRSKEFQAEITINDVFGW